MKVQKNVDECYDDDEGRSICRIDPNTLLELDLSPGQIVRISSESDTYLKAWRSDREDWNEDSIYIDEFARHNAQAEIGDSVTIEKVELNPLDQIYLLPYRGADIELTPKAVEKLKGQHIKKPVQVGSVLATLMSDSGRPMPLVVTGTHDKNPGIITESTTVELPESFLIDPDEE